MADLWFLKINISSVFDSTVSSSFNSNKNQFNFNKCSSHFSTIHLHAIFMFAGWAVFINMSNMMSKYCTNKSSRFIRPIYCIFKVIKLTEQKYVFVKLNIYLNAFKRYLDLF